MNNQSLQMTVESDRFRILMKEAYELSCIAQQPKYNLQSEESLRLYDIWAPYVMNSQESINSTGYKIFIIEMMSILLVMKDEMNNKDRFKVKADDIKEIYNFRSRPQIYKQPSSMSKDEFEKLNPKCKQCFKTVNQNDAFYYKVENGKYSDWLHADCEEMYEANSPKEIYQGNIIDFSQYKMRRR